MHNRNRDAQVVDARLDSLEATRGRILAGGGHVHEPTRARGATFSLGSSSSAKGYADADARGKAATSLKSSPRRAARKANVLKQTKSEPDAPGTRCTDSAHSLWTL